MSELEGDNSGADLNSVEIPDVDAIMEEGNQNYEIPMGDEEPQQAAQQPVEESYSFKWNNRDITATKDQLTKWAQQGYDYSQKMNQFNTQKQEWESKYKPYQDIDQFAQQNPEWWAHVQQAWEKRAQMQGQPTSELPPQVEQKISELDQKLNSIFQEKHQEQIAKQDQSLSQEIQSMREQYKHLDWSKVNDQGYDLEMQVLAYANERGISNFTDAFKAYNLDRILSIAQERTKENMVKEKQKQTKMGLLGSNQAPKKGFSEVSNPKSRSYNSLVAEALAELESGAV